ncbi:MAG TPA: bifunctional ornithine acetyltransferase/N-acetylglutamate synthase [Actinobacteria bacterium]|nr:bifunctional ornithine acetyltransferase/N-acetylglutamate synthase [Actinomycetota bacterium]
MSVTAAKGFRAAGVAAGLKSSGSRDVAVVVNDGPDHVAAAVFTSNKFKAAPVVWSQQAVADGRADAVILNSGGANACTGPDGFADTHRTAEHGAAVLNVSAGDVLVCSTGLIGERLPMSIVLEGVTTAAESLSTDGGSVAAEAIMTTDSVAKEAIVTGDGFTVGGMAKGAGMLAPALATMLVVVTTDAQIEPDALRTALHDAVRVTFDRIDADGCMSTNDTVIVLASGASGVQPDTPAFTAALTTVCHDLAQQLIADAEGASKHISIVVRQAATEDDAVTVARAIARSNLLKCAIHGEDPNWGRVLAAAGTTDAQFEPTNVSVAINGVRVCHGGAADADRTLCDLSDTSVLIEVTLGAGECDAQVWTTDLTAEYVHENSAYST